jgi:transposase
MQSPVIEERAVGTSPRRHRTVEEKRRIVQESLKPGTSVAVVARRFDVNANQVFTWRRQHRRGALTGKRLAADEARLLPVAVHEVGAETAERSTSAASEALCTGRIEIEFGGGRILSSSMLKSVMYRCDRRRVTRQLDRRLETNL